VYLDIDPNHVWDYTLYQIKLLFERSRVKDEMLWIKVGHVCSAILAPHIPKNKKGPTPKDWNPYNKTVSPEDARQRMIEHLKTAKINPEIKKQLLGDVGN
jgi:hypothetical protein